MKKYIFTNEQTQEIIRLYQEELYSQKSIGEKFGVDRGVIKRVLLENGIELKAHNHKYHANYDIFSKIDTAEKAYWLGFIAADGYVTTPRATAGRTIGINISRKDKEILNKFIKFLDSNIPIVDHVQTQGFSNNSKMSRVSVNSTKMALDLEEKGITSQKSLTLKPPYIDEKFYLSFIL